MRRSLFSLFVVLVLICSVLQLTSVNAQERKAAITGRATDTNHDPLVGAKVELQPLGQTAVTDAEGAFKISDLAPGSYTVNISYVGFSTFSKQVTLAAGGTTNVDAELQIETVSEQVIVRGERERGEIEALNRELTSDNIVQVLPADVIISLPNTNIADAVGRLPSVSLERDEGEGKYVQIRGTEPRLSNVTVDGVHVPSPESVRNVKLDTIPADMVDSIEVYKTLSANMEGDAIGGSVNLVTKKATDQPYLLLEGLGGITPIEGTRGLQQYDGTFGKRFGREKRLGILFDVSYDYNERGIDDIEPSWTTNDFGTPGNPNVQPVFAGTDVRAYQYYRKRWGVGTSIDYKLGANSLVYLRGLYSEFRNYGEDWIYSPSINSYVSPTLSGTDSNVTYADVIRRPAGRIINVTAGANHSLGKTLVAYEVALGHGRASGGFFSANFGNGQDANNNPNGPQNVQYALDTSDPFTPKFKQLSGTNVFDPTQYLMAPGFFAPLSLNTQDNIFERDITGSASVTRQYSFGSHFGAFEVGGKIRDTHKSQLNSEHDFFFNGVLRLSDVVGTVPDFSYYFGNYKLLPFSSENKIVAFFNANRGLFPENFNMEHLRADSNDYTTTERISAGYVMNTITIGHFRMQGGLRIEGTQGHFLGTVVNTTPRGVTFLSDTLVAGEKTYTDFLPSVQVQYNFNGSTNIRAVYGRGIARPNFSDIPPSRLVDQSFSLRPRVTEGNPNLKPTHADNFDILFEHYLKTVGIIEGGWFYKHMTDPIVQTLTLFPANDPQFPGFRLRQQTNFDTAYITGVEFAWQQHLKFLPGPLNGMGVSANYSYTKSGTNFPAGVDGAGNPNRTDNPPLIRQSPNNWNFDATYDKGIVSARMGLSHNDANIQFYGFQSTPNAANGGPKGPNGDFYFYPHTQVDAQASFRLPGQHGLYAIVSGLNLTNEVFGFYQGSERFPTQREYYSRTVSFGFRWTPPLGK